MNSTGSAAAPDLCSYNFWSSGEHDKGALGEGDLLSPSSAGIASFHKTGGRKIHAAAS